MVPVFQKIFGEIFEKNKIKNKKVCRITNENKRETFYIKINCRDLMKFECLHNEKSVSFWVIYDLGF